MKGSSTGFEPIQVRSIKFAMNNQYINFPRGLKFRDFNQLVCKKGVANNIKIENTKPKTPPSLSGIALNIA